MPGKLEIKKFDPVARKHVIYKETKLNNPVSSKKKLLFCRSFSFCFMIGLEWS